MKVQAKIFVTLKGSVLDPQGVAVTKALHAMKYDQVDDVRVGKYLEVVFTVDNDSQAHELVAKMCDQLLTNPVIEKYTYELVEVLA